MVLNKRFFTTFYILIAAVVAVLAVEFFNSSEQQEIVFPREKLTIETAAGKAFEFKIEVATTPEQQARGLMFRRHMEENAGMLFLFQNEQDISFWMKNTYISLDMLFIDRTGKIVDIAKSTVPMSTAQIRSKEPAIAVLEILGGLSNELTIETGDRVRHSFFEK